MSCSAKIVQTWCSLPLLPSITIAKFFMMRPVSAPLLSLGFGLVSIILVPRAIAHPNLKHGALQVHDKSQAHNLPLARPPGAVAESTETPPYVLTFFTPSPSATPIPITRQSQVETSFVPQYTLCALPPLAFSDVSLTGTVTDLAPYRNYSISTPSGNGTCTTLYSPTPETICATVLTGIATRITVSECDQEITFSSRYGYALQTPELPSGNLSLITPSPSIQTLTTYYIAPWQSLTAATPPADVDVKICAIVDDGSRQCVTVQEVWHVELVTVTRTVTSKINLTTAIPGPAQLVIETIHVDITRAMTTVSLSTTMKLEYELESETTSKTTRSSLPAIPLSTSIRTRTITLIRASDDPEVTSTVTQTSVLTDYSGTSTVVITGNPLTL